MDTLILANAVLFLSTLSLRRATTQMQAAFKGPEISIHALLAESDNVACGDWHKLRDFYPRSPCGERLFLRSGPMTRRYFYPRSPCGERRAYTAQFAYNSIISIHALLAESDRQGRVLIFGDLDFYPRSPCGERLFSGDHGHISGDISIHALLAESDKFPPGSEFPE